MLCKFLMSPFLFVWPIFRVSKFGTHGLDTKAIVASEECKYHFFFISMKFRPCLDRRVRGELASNSTILPHALQSPSSKLSPMFCRYCLPNSLHEGLANSTTHVELPNVPSNPWWLPFQPLMWPNSLPLLHHEKIWVPTPGKLYLKRTELLE